MRLPPSARWIGLAILGVLIAAGVSIAASSVASQQIGLASEPISAGDALAPRTAGTHRGSGPGPRAVPRLPNRNGTATTPVIPPLQQAVPPTTEPAPSSSGDDSGGPSTGGDGGGPDD